MINKINEIDIFACVKFLLFFTLNENILNNHNEKKIKFF